MNRRYNDASLQSTCESGPKPYAHIEFPAWAKMIALGVEQRNVVAIVEKVLDVQRYGGLRR